MSIRIDVCNFALTVLGEQTITSIEDESDRAQTLESIYYIAKDAVLEEAEWTFATRRFLPAISATAPEWGWTSAFPLPSDIVRVTSVDRNWTSSSGYIYDVQQERNPVDHVVEYVNGVGRSILCNEDEIFCKGVRRIEDEGIYSPLFVEAFGCKLAYLAGEAITASNTKTQIALALYVEALKKAKSRDAMQNTTRRMRNRTLSNARYRGTGW